jgi:hypothetical protein
MAEIPRKDRAALKSDVALSRERMGRELGGLRYELDFPAKLKSSFRRSPAIWVGALVLLGVLMAVAPARKKKVYAQPKVKFGKKKGAGEGVAQAGFAMAGVKLASDLLRPILIKFVTQKLSGYARNRPASRV